MKITVSLTRERTVGASCVRRTASTDIFCDAADKPEDIKQLAEVIAALLSDELRPAPGTTETP